MTTLVYQTSGTMRHVSEERLLEAIHKLDVTIVPIGIVPMTDLITGLEDYIPDEPTLVYGSTKLVRLLSNHRKAFSVFPDWPAERANLVYDHLRCGVFYSKPSNFSHTTLAKSSIGRFLLNSAFADCKLKDVLDVQVPEDTFVKPNGDMKLFSGCLVPQGSTLRKELLKTTQDHRLATSGKSLVILAIAQDTCEEYRFIVVDGKVVAGSQYKDKSGTVKTNAIVPEYARGFADDMATLYQPDEAFTLDVVRMPDDQMRIVEYNCVNASGLYECDHVAVLSALLAKKAAK